MGEIQPKKCGRSGANQGSTGSDEDYWVYCLVLLGAFAAFRLVALGALVSKARHFY